MEGGKGREGSLSQEKQEEASQTHLVTYSSYGYRVIETDWRRVECNMRVS